MKIPFLNRKNVNFLNVEKLLSLSYEKNHFTNNGPLKLKLESTIHKLLNLRNNKKVVVVNNGTSAIQMAMLYYNKLNPKLKWALPSFTFPSAITPKISNINIVPVSDRNGMPDISVLEKHDAVVLTNLFGTYVDIEFWSNYAKKNEKILIFDNASSPLTNIDGKNICEYGDISIGSLHHTKLIGFGEGGFIVCDEEKYHDIDKIAGFGFNYSDGERKYDIFSSNFKASDVSCAFQIDYINSINFDHILKIQKRYFDLIECIEEVSILNYNKNVIYGNMPIVFNKEIEANYFFNKQIQVGKYYKPLSNDEGGLSLFKKIINFPLHQDLEFKDIDYIAECIKGAV